MPDKLVRPRTAAQTAQDKPKHCANIITEIVRSLDLDCVCRGDDIAEQWQQ